jgi:RNA polymerase sigma factor for flagellar operon FliA
MLSTEVWQTFLKTGDSEAREKLISENLRLVYHVAWQILRKSPGDLELDELVSAGTIGLMEAIDKFDPSRGFAFSTLAAPRIRGAILDDLRKRDSIPRSVRTKRRSVDEARDSLMRTLKRDPLPAETARELGIEMEEYWRWEKATRYAQPTSLDQLKASEPTGVSSSSQYSTLSAPTIDLDAQINSGEEIEILREELMNLDQRDRMVLTLCYLRGLKLREIGEIIGLTESRVSQIRCEALQQLRIRMIRLREEVA